MPGYATLMVCILFLFSIQFIFLGVLGEYIARIFNQVKFSTDCYIIEDIIKSNTDE